MDNTKFAKIFTTSLTYWWFSSRLVKSSTKKDIVVSDPQNPISVKRKYFPSRCHYCDSIMKSSSMNEPITLTIKTLAGNVLKINGDLVLLYLK